MQCPERIWLRCAWVALLAGACSYDAGNLRGLPDAKDSAVAAAWDGGLDGAGYRPDQVTVPDTPLPEDERRDDERGPDERGPDERSSADTTHAGDSLNDAPAAPADTRAPADARDRDVAGDTGSGGVVSFGGITGTGGSPGSGGMPGSGGSSSSASGGAGSGGAQATGGTTGSLCSGPTPPNYGASCVALTCVCGLQLVGAIDCGGNCATTATCNCCGLLPCP